MGLDWVVLSKVDVTKLTDSDDIERYEKMMDLINETGLLEEEDYVDFEYLHNHFKQKGIMITPEESIGGIILDTKKLDDPVYRKKVESAYAFYNPERSLYPTLHDFVMANEGKWAIVPKDCDYPLLGKVPVGSFASSTSFRAKNLYYSIKYDEELLHLLYQSYSPEGMLYLANTLEEYLEAGREIAEERYEVESFEEDVPIIQAAIDWLRFWAGKGHPMLAWA
jgi:hypothetical protein